MIEQLKPLAVFGDGAQTRDFIFVKDVAKTNVQALQAKMTGVCNVATGTSVSLLHLIKVLSRCVNRPLEIVHQPAQASDILFSEANINRFRSLFDASNLMNLENGLQLLLEANRKA